MKTYYNEQGKYQSDYDRLWKFVPISGKSEVLAGELIRAVSRLAYDFYNNGMGNNTSGAVNFLKEYNVFENALDKFNIIYEHSRGRTYKGNYSEDSELLIAIEYAIDSTIELILKNPKFESQPNDVDLFEFSDEEQSFCEVCEVVLDSSNSSYYYSCRCSDCDDEEEDDYNEEE